MVRDSGVAVRAVDFEIVTLLRNGRKKSAEGISIEDVGKIFGVFLPFVRFWANPLTPKCGADVPYE